MIMDNLRAFAEAVGVDIKTLDERLKDLEGLKSDWMDIGNFMRVKGLGDMIAVEIKVEQQTPLHPNSIGTIPEDVARINSRITFNPVVFSNRSNTDVLTRQIEIGPGGAVYVRGLGYTGRDAFFGQVNFLV